MEWLRLSDLTDEGRESFLKDVRRLFALEPTLLAELGGLLNTDWGVVYESSDRPELTKVLQDHGISDDIANSAISAARFINRRAAEAEDLSDQRLIDDVESLATELNILGFTERRNALSQLLVPTPAFRERARLAEYENGWQPYLKAFASNIEIRTAMGLKDQQPKGYVPWVNIRLKVGYSDQSESDQYVQLGLSASDLDWFIERLEDLRKRLRIVQDNAGPKLPNFTSL